MIKVLTSKNTLKRLVKELPKFEERDKNATDTANNLLSSANEIKLNKIILAELEAMENHLLPIIETLATGEHEQVAACFNYVLYGMGTKFFANQDNDTGYKNVILDKSMKNIQREKENLKRKISESENFLQGYPKINKLLKAM